MNLFCDTSALIKNYIDEVGSSRVETALHEASEVTVSTLTLVECFSTLRRILLEGKITEEEYVILKKEIQYDFSFFVHVEPSDVLLLCEGLIDIYQLKTLDSIQLASALGLKKSIDYFLCFDSKLIHAAEAEGLRVLAP
ncbi:MAG: type II toxin-antitoxin system VapC family toxin [Spirochaetaceae bacterium]